MRNDEEKMCTGLGTRLAGVAKKRSLDSVDRVFERDADVSTHQTPSGGLLLMTPKIMVIRRWSTTLGVFSRTASRLHQRMLRCSFPFTIPSQHVAIPVHGGAKSVQDPFLHPFSERNGSTVSYLIGGRCARSISVKGCGKPDMVSFGQETAAGVVGRGLLFEKTGEQLLQW